MVLGVDDGIAHAMAIFPGQPVEAVAVLDVAFVEGAFGRGDDPVASAVLGPIEGLVGAGDPAFQSSPATHSATPKLALSGPTWSKGPG
jgi:hypothetical protein